MKSRLSALSIALDSNRTYRISVLETRSATEAVSWGDAELFRLAGRLAH